jgi:hypothetical protein
VLEQHEADGQGVGQGDVPELGGGGADEERIARLEGVAEALVGRASGRNERMFA